MAKIEYGSIEIIRGVGQNSVSEGVVFGPDDDVDDDDISGAVKRMTGATVASARANPHAANRCKGVWNVTDKNKKQGTVKVWITERG